MLLDFCVTTIIKADPKREELVKENVRSSFMVLLHQSHQDLYQIFERCAKSTKTHMQNLFSCNLSSNYPWQSSVYSLSQWSMSVPSLLLCSEMFYVTVPSQKCYSTVKWKIQLKSNVYLGCYVGVWCVPLISGCSLSCLYWLLNSYMIHFLGTWCCMVIVKKA